MPFGSVKTDISRFQNGSRLLRWSGVTLRALPHSTHCCVRAPIVLLEEMSERPHASLHLDNIAVALVLLSNRGQDGPKRTDLNLERVWSPRSGFVAKGCVARTRHRFRARFRCGRNRGTVCSGHRCFAVWFGGGAGLRVVVTHRLILQEERQDQSDNAQQRNGALCSHREERLA